MPGTVLERRLKTHKYLIQFQDPINESSKTEWIGVENVTSETLHKEKLRRIKRIHTEHKRKYLIPLLHRDRLKSLDVLNNGSVKILLDPKGDGNCQFEAIVDQLSKHGIFTTASRLRKTAVDHLKRHEKIL